MKVHREGEKKARRKEQDEITVSRSSSSARVWCEQAQEEVHLLLWGKCRGTGL